MTIRLLQFGVTGQVARELLAQAGGHEVAVEALSRSEADLADPEACAQIVRDRKPDLVVLAAAYTAVDLAETERDLGWRPRISLADGLEDTVRWYVENAHWVDGIRQRGFHSERLGLVKA